MKRPTMKKEKGWKLKHNKGPGRTITKRRWKNLRTQTHVKNTIVHKNHKIEPVLWQGNYHSYLKSKQWRKVKRGYFLWLREQNKRNKNYGLRCLDCNRQMTKKNRMIFHVHHNTYERLGCERMEDLALLCKKCHDKRHETLVERYLFS